MLSIEDLWEAASKMCKEYDMAMPKDIQFNKRLKSTLGQCSRDGVIQMGYDFCQLNEDAVVIDLLSHEMIHVMFFDYGHGDVFKYMCAKIGISPHVWMDHKVVMPPSRWMYVCDDCGESYYTYRKLTDERYCSECHSDMQLLEVFVGHKMYKRDKK